MARTAEDGELGRQGEKVAVRHLKKCGYAIVKRNYRSRLGEIDIIAQEGKKLCFVEVKARRGREYGEGKEAVTATKQAKIVRAALGFLMQHKLMAQDCRFDVVAVEFDKDGKKPEIELVRDAFPATSFYNY